MSDLRSENGTCPVPADDDIQSDVPQPDLSQWDELVIPRHRRMISQRATNEADAPEVRLYYDDKEIVFDEPDLFAFGETLAQQARFIAGDAMGWGDGYEWPRVQELLQQLIEAGVLAHAGTLDNDAAAVGDTVQPSPLPISSCSVARTWFDCEAITQELTGRPVELGYLELIMPVYRVAHIALDADARQVGEANVFPPSLRLNVPTEWRTCNLPGTRYQSTRPMNVTAMRVMRAHWPQMMAAILRVREGYVSRFPEAEGAWTIGHLERLAVVVLALPTYQLMRPHDRVANGELHPVLSSMFRVTDGVRMVAHQMMYIPGTEPTLPPDQLVTIDQILDYAERTFAFHSAFGVCAGPKAMVRELLQVLMEGHGTKEYKSVVLDPAVQAAFDGLDVAIDYALLGLRACAVMFSLWLAVARAYERLAEIVEALSPINAASFVALRQGMIAQRAILKTTALAQETWRTSRASTYAFSYRHCGRGVRGPVDTTDLDAVLAPTWTSEHRQVEAELRSILLSLFEPAVDDADQLVSDISDCIMDFLLRGQQILRAAITVQDDINRLLGRESPSRPMSAADMDVYLLLRGNDPNELIYLIDELERLLGIEIDFKADRMTIRQTGRSCTGVAFRNSSDIVSVE